jgi:hypothetical protein
MDQPRMKPMVLARFPTMNLARGEDVHGGTPPSRGRILDQSLSFKLLAAAVLLLVAVATVPLALSRNASSTTPSAMAEPSPAWQISQPRALVDAAPVCVAPVPASLPAPTSLSPLPGVRPKPQVAGVPLATPSADAPLMSAWPNPAYPTSPQDEVGVEEPRAGANQAMAIRPTEYLRSRP